MIPEARRNHILDYIRNKKTVTIKEISNKFEISEITVRRDFDILTKQKSLKKVYGGATISNSDISEPILAQRLRENLEEKKELQMKQLKEFLMEILY